MNEDYYIVMTLVDEKEHPEYIKMFGKFSYMLWTGNVAIRIFNTFEEASEGLISTKETKKEE